VGGERPHEVKQTPAAQQRFNIHSRWARDEMAKLGPTKTHEAEVGQLWLIIDELMRRLALAETTESKAA